jgi:hypothetical protein
MVFTHMFGAKFMQSDHSDYRKQDDKETAECIHKIANHRFSSYPSVAVFPKVQLLGVSGTFMAKDQI